MIRTYFRKFLVTPYRLLRQRGLLSLVVFTYRWLRWKILTIRIRRLYFASQARRGESASTLDETACTREIVTIGLQAISEVNRAFADSYSKRDGLRFLIHLSPEGGSQYFYLLDLAQCLEHTGVKVRCYATSAGSLERVLSDFRPTVFLAVDQPFIAHTLDTECLSRYKKQHGLARLFIPHYVSPLQLGRPVSSEEKERISLHRQGRLADAFFGYFEDVFWDVFCAPWKETGLRYCSIPFAANPLRHYPVFTAKDLDWGIATANADLGERAALTHKYMRRIIKKYHGAIAGSNWGKRIDLVPPDEIMRFFCRVRISPNLAAKSNRAYPLDCGAKAHELSAMGVFQLASETEALRKYYSPAEIVGVRNVKEFNALFDYFLDKPEVRLMYTRNGMARTLAENTYFHRIDKFIVALNEAPELF